MKAPIAILSFNRPGFLAETLGEPLRLLRPKFTADGGGFLR